MKKVFLFALLVVFIFTITSCGGNSEPKQEHSKASASVMAEEFVKEKLISPGSAKFQPFLDTDIQDLGSGRYKITSYVDSQNKLGALVRSNYVCTVKYAGGNKWLLEDLQVK